MAQPTKVVYFTPRSVTPFMPSISKPVGQITLWDFEGIFDRPGFYRYHCKTLDKEFRYFYKTNDERLSDLAHDTGI